MLIDNRVFFKIYIIRYNLIQYFKNDIYILDKCNRFLENSHSNSRQLIIDFIIYLIFRQYRVDIKIKIIDVNENIKFISRLKHKFFFSNKIFSNVYENQYFFKTIFFAFEFELSKKYIHVCF